VGLTIGTYIDASAASATVAVHALDLATGAPAGGFYAIKWADAKPNLCPVSVLPVQLAVALQDSAKVSLAGVPVTFPRLPAVRFHPRKS